MTHSAVVTYAVIARRRRLRWHISVPGFGKVTTFRRSRVEAAARGLIELRTGRPEAHVVVLSRPRSWQPPSAD